MRAAPLLILAVLALGLFACAKTEPQVTGTNNAGNTAGDAITKSFDSGLPPEQPATSDTSGDKLDTGLAQVSQ